jgi:hypothetical protein
MPGPLTIIFTVLLAHYDANHPNYLILKSFMMRSVDETVSTLVKWTGQQYRMVVGVMFSGLYGTSWGDTAYVRIVNTTFRFFLVRLLRERNEVDLLEKLSAHRNPLLVYGDNILLSTHRDVLKYILAPLPGYKYGLYEKFFAEAWGMRLKHSDTGYFDSFWTEIHTQFHNNVAARTDIIVKGPIYLKRYFIKVPRYDDPSQFFAMPFRDTVDYYTKSMTTANFDSDQYTWLSRWMGLMMDTAGTNATAYDYLLFLVNEFFAHKNKDTPCWRELVDAYFSLDKDNEKIFKRHGLSASSMLRLRSRTELCAYFAPESEAIIYKSGVLTVYDAAELSS